MKCPRCLTENREGELLCVKCSYPLIIPVATKQLPDSSTDVLQLPSTGSTRLLDKMKLRFMVGEAKFDVDMGEQLTVGRGGGVDAQGKPDVDLTAYVGPENELGVSRFHCIIQRVGMNLTVRDSGSTNGTWLNGERLHNGDPRFLHDGDNLWLGRLSLAVYFVI